MWNKVAVSPTRVSFSEVKLVPVLNPPSDEEPERLD